MSLGELPDTLKFFLFTWDSCLQKGGRAGAPHIAILGVILHHLG